MSEEQIAAIAELREKTERLGGGMRVVGLKPASARIILELVDGLESQLRSA